eukprot:COSAG05_NODE_10421_length_566_cov_1.021413_1_plen_53_part_10
MRHTSTLGVTQHFLDLTTCVRGTLSPQQTRGLKGVWMQFHIIGNARMKNKKKK